MRGAERDELLIEQSQTLGRIDSRLASLERARARRERDPLPPLKSLPRVRRDGLPGWDFEVPAESVKEGVDPVVTCRCEAETTLTMKLPMECSGECGRWFLRTTAGVRVKRFDEAEAA